MSKQSKEIYEFAQFRLEVAERRLSRDGRVIRLADKAFDTLCVLVRHHGRLVTKDQLLSAVWPDAIVEENNLDQKVSMLRAALGDRGRGKEKFIETVRGHGYRFVAKVTEIFPTHSDASSQAQVDRIQGSITSPPLIRSQSAGNVIAVAAWQHAPEQPKPQLVPDALPAPSADSNDREAISGTRPWLLRTGIAAALLIGAIAVVWAVLSSPSGPTSGTSQIGSIAILPFTNETGDPESDYLSDGLTDSLISSVSQIPNLAVKAHSSVLHYRGKEIDPTDAGKELSTEAVLTGRVTRSADDVSISLELVEVASGNVIWADRFQRRASELPQLQREVARDVASRLRSRLSKADEQRIAKIYTTDPEANTYFLQGIYLLNKRSAEDIRASITFFQRATLEDPAYAKAYAAMSLAHIILPDYSGGMTRNDIKQAEQNFREAFLRARELDDTLPEVQVLAGIHCELEWNIDCAVQSYQRAIEFDPNFALARHVSSRLFGAVGRTDEALEHIYKARDLDPLSPSIAFNLGGRLADARRYDDAIQQYKRVLAVQPNHALTHFALAMAYEAKGLYRDAISEYRVAWVLLEKFSEGEAERKAAQLSKGLEKGGPQGYWEVRLKQQTEDYEIGTGQRVRIAVCLARLGRTGEALEELERSWVAREPDILWIRSEPAFDPLQGDPQFEDLLRRIGVKS
jgi:TolB-like protein/DNA-binding winged helix-turn-helix (wHTH) protein/Tfp pilus assembly protein PilF